MKRSRSLILSILAVALTALPAMAQQITPDRLPPGFIPPPLHPRDAQLETVELGEGVYALVSSRPPVDNSGFIVGDDGVLVVDAHINGRMAEQIQRAVREITDKPILYLVNTNYHGDHTFGNYAFPEATQIIAHTETARRMAAHEDEKRFLMVTVDNDPSVFADVELRLPDIAFDDFVRIDLGGRSVDLYHFGPGNTPGDVVVWEPQTRTAWTGNLVLGAGLIPFLIEGGPAEYRDTMRSFAATLDPAKVVPGHGPISEGVDFDRYDRYLDELAKSVARVIDAGETPHSAVSTIALDPAFEAPEGSPFAAFNAGLHVFNVWRSVMVESAR